MYKQHTVYILHLWNKSRWICIDASCGNAIKNYERCANDILTVQKYLFLRGTYINKLIQKQMIQN